MAKKDYYQVLGVDRDATQDQMKRAYRKLAMKYHPDRNKGDGSAAELFKEATEAYEVLTDDGKRRIYDQYGHDGLKQGGYQRGFSSFEDIFSMFGDIFGGGGGSIFEEFFNGRGRGGGRRNRPQRGASLKCELDISLNDAFAGIEKTIDLKRSEICEECKGSGAKPGTSPQVCNQCRGAGEVLQSQGFFQLRTMCPQCGGTGQTIETPCTGCHGSGRTPMNRQITVRIPPGIHDSTQMRVTGEGEPGFNQGPRGDLYCIIRVHPHQLFERHEDDLIYEVPIAFSQAALGANLEVPSLNKKVVLKIPAGTQTGRVFRMKGLGMPNMYGHGRGDLLIRVKIETPKKMTKQQEKILREFAELEERNVTPERKSFFEKMKSLFD